MDAAKGNFRLWDGSAAFSVGFRDFNMDSFGVVSPRVKALARTPDFPELIAGKVAGKKELIDEPIDFMEASVKDLKTLGERSATGMDDTRGVLVLEVPQRSAAAAVLRPNDVILSFNGRRIDNLGDLTEARMRVTGSVTEITVFRNQRSLEQKIELKIH